MRSIVRFPVTNTADLSESLKQTTLLAKEMLCAWMLDASTSSMSFIHPHGAGGKDVDSLRGVFTS